MSVGAGQDDTVAPARRDRWRPWRRPARWGWDALALAVAWTALLGGFVALGIHVVIGFGRLPGVVLGEPDLPPPTGSVASMPPRIAEAPLRLPTVGKGRPLGSPAAVVYRRQRGTWGGLKIDWETLVVPADGRPPVYLDPSLDCPALSPDGRLLVAMEPDGAQLMLDLVDGTARRSGEPAGCLESGPRVAVQWSPEGAALTRFSRRAVPSFENLTIHGVHGWLATDQLLVSGELEGPDRRTGVFAVELTTGAVADAGVRLDHSRPGTDTIGGVTPGGRVLVWRDEEEAPDHLLVYPPRTGTRGRPVTALTMAGDRDLASGAPQVATGLLDRPPPR